MSGFLFNEVSALQQTDSGLYQLKAGPYKWLRVSGCAFNLMEALVMSTEGSNAEFSDSIVNVTLMIHVLQT